MAKPNILFVCSVNRMRSLTADEIYAGDERFEVDSAGTDLTARVRIETYHLEWADVIIVMEKQHRNKIIQQFPEFDKNKPIICLHIPDVYHYMEPSLIAILRTKFERVYSTSLAPLF